MTQRRQADRSPHIHHLEDRRLFASFATLSAGTLTLTGTTGNDTFALLERSGKLRVIRNGIPAQFAASEVTKVVATLEAGDDSFVMNSALTLVAKVFGGDGNDTINTAGGADRIEGGDGDDLLASGVESNTVVGGSGDDTVDYIASSRKVVGYLHVLNSTQPGFPQSWDWIDLFDTNGSFRRGSDRDSVISVERVGGTRFGDSLEMRIDEPRQNSPYDAPPTVQLIGHFGDDSLRVMHLGALSDLVHGRGFPVMQVSGQEGNDYIEIPVFTSRGIYEGGTGDDLFYAPSTFEIMNEFQSISGGTGLDTLTLGATLYVNYQMPEDLENFTLASNGGNPTIRIFGNQLPNVIDLRVAEQGCTLYGGANNDTLYGGRTNDSIRGDTGDDVIYGGDGADRLYGDDGNDTIDGQAGRDLIYGGAGNDRGKKQSTDRAFDSIEILL